MPSYETQHPKESLQEQNMRQIRELAHYGPTFIQAALLTNTVVEEVAREQRVEHAIHFKKGVEGEDFVGGRFTYKTKRGHIRSRAELEVSVPLATDNDNIILDFQDPEDTSFSIDVFFSAYTDKDVTSSNAPQTWNIKALEGHTNSEEREKFKKNLKIKFIEAIDNARNPQIELFNSNLNT